MNKFENKLCPVCRSRFNSNADVVVCPVCGTPHHRVCYQSKNDCALSNLHSEGFVWNGYLPDEPKPERVIDSRTLEEESENISDEKIDDVLMTEIESYDPDFADFVRQFRDGELGEDGVSMKELTAYAATSLFHYGTAFDSFRSKRGGKKRRTYFNICSGFLTPAFQFYRKMDLFGMLVMLLMLLPYIAAAFAPEFFLESAGVYIINILDIAEKVLLCLFGDYIYYRHAVRKIKKFRSSYDGNSRSMEYYSQLAEEGKPSILRAIVGLLVFVLCATSLMVLPGLLGKTA